MNRARKPIRMSVLAALGAVALTVAVSVPASAASSGISGPPGKCGSNTYWNTARVNSFAQNTVTFRANSVGPCGGTLVVGLRASSGTASSHASGAARAGQTVAVRTSSSQSWVRAGTFWITTATPGACGGGCSGTWNATLTYNVRWMP